MSEKGTLTMEEKREAFVRQRFSQANVFCIEDVEDWLAGQLEADQPDLEYKHMWGKVADLVKSKIERRMERAQAEGVLETVPEVEKIVEHVAEVERSELPRYIDSDMFPLIRPLIKDDTTCFFLGLKDKLIFSCWQHLGPLSGRNVFYVFSRPGKITKAKILDLIGVPLAAWRNHSWRWQLARNKLYYLCQQLIDQARWKAQADFDRAVAVSEDGRSIVAAHRVFLYSLIEEDTLAIYEYPASAFQKRKIRLHTSSGLKRGLFGSSATIPLDVDPREEVLARVKTTILKDRKKGYLQMLGHVQLKDFPPEYLALPAEERFDAAEEYHVRCFCSSLQYVQDEEFPEGGLLVYQGDP